MRYALRLSILFRAEMREEYLVIGKLNNLLNCHIGENRTKGKNR